MQEFFNFTLADAYRCEKRTSEFLKRQSLYYAITVPEGSGYFQGSVSGVHSRKTIRFLL